MHFGNIFRVEFWRYITVEPAYFLAYLATTMMDFFNVNMYLQKSCRFDRFSEPDLNTRCDDEKRGETFVAEVYMTALTATFVVGLTVCVFATSYSDLAGRKRKLFVIVPLVGLLMQSVSAMLQSYFWHWSPLLGVVLNSILPDLCGGWMTVMVFCVLLCYDKTRTDTRHVVLTTVMCLKALAALVGRGTAGHLLRAVGFFYSFAICTLLLTLSLGCALLLIPPEKSNEVEHRLSLRQIFSLKKTCESLKMILFPEKPLKHRIAIRLMMLVSMMVFFQFYGEESVRYLYFRYRFHWDEKRFSTFSAYRVLMTVIGNIISKIGEEIEGGLQSCLMGDEDMQTEIEEFNKIASFHSSIHQK